MSELKNHLVKQTSKQVADYLDKTYSIEVDYLDIAEIINLNMRVYLNEITELDDGK